MATLDENVWIDNLDENRDIWIYNDLETDKISNSDNSIINNNDNDISSNNDESTTILEEPDIDQLAKTQNDEHEKEDTNIWADVPTHNPRNINNTEIINKNELDSVSEHKEDKIQETIKPTEKPHDNKMEKDNDFDDDFGDFEEIQTTKLEFDRPIENIIKDIFSGNINNQQEEIDEFNKSVFLVEGDNKPMKCYNILMADDRQFLSRQFPTINIRQRGCVEQLKAHKELVTISNEWVFDEKGITKNINKDKKNVLGKNNIFRWSTQLDIKEKDTENIAESALVRERKLVGQKLLTAAYQQSRKIIDEKMEVERREKILMDKMKWEREQRIKKQKELKEEEMAKYKTADPELDLTKKKKGFFGKIFNSKSKIAKDHISHKKIINNNEEQLNSNIKELSLKEQLELDGYELGTTKKSKYKSKKRKDDEENDDENDDDSDDIFGGDVNGYNILDPNVDIQHGDAGNVFGKDEKDSDGDGDGDQTVHTIINDAPPETNSALHEQADLEDSNIDDSFGGFENYMSANAPQEQSPNITDNHNKVDYGDDDSFEEFQTHTPAADTTPRKTPEDIGNLIDL